MIPRPTTVRVINDASSRGTNISFELRSLRTREAIACKRSLSFGLGMFCLVMQVVLLVDNERDDSRVKFDA